VKTFQENLSNMILLEIKTSSIRLVDEGLPGVQQMLYTKLLTHIKQNEYF
jgi:hypothetical protein